ncbi:hypothetical protein D3C72_1901840 [compost metagenome]
MELLSVKGATAPQNNVANTDCPVARPMLLPPPSIRPRPTARISPDALTEAANLRISQICPAGWTPRTILRLTTVAMASVPWPLETGRTPTPPLKRSVPSSARVVDARAPTSRSTGMESASVLFMSVPPYRHPRGGVGGWPLGEERGRP